MPWIWLGGNTNVDNYNSPADAQWLDVAQAINHHVKILREQRNFQLLVSNDSLVSYFK